MPGSSDGGTNHCRDAPDPASITSDSILTIIHSSGRVVLRHTAQYRRSVNLISTVYAGSTLAPSSISPSGSAGQRQSDTSECLAMHRTRRFTILRLRQVVFHGSKVYRVDILIIPSHMPRTNRKRRSDESLRFRRLWAQCSLAWPIPHFFHSSLLCLVFPLHMPG